MKRNESKYKQVVNHVIDGINNGSYKKGDWILSINEFRKNYNLSRDTVFAGLSELKSKGIIDYNPNCAKAKCIPPFQRIQRVQGRSLQFIHVFHQKDRKRRSLFSQL